LKPQYLIDGVLYLKATQQPEPTTISKEESLKLASILDHKGFDYSFRHYSSFSHGPNKVECARFHQLIKQYRAALECMEAYLIANGIIDTNFI
jgi:hypothetical protein